MITKADHEFLSLVKEHRDLGFGRMIQIIGHAWYRTLEREHPGQEGGAFADSTCFALLPEDRQDTWLRLLEAEEQSGMQY